MPPFSFVASLEFYRYFYYVYLVLRDYDDKRACNKRFGPGGGTRRLHQEHSIEYC